MHFCSEKYTKWRHFQNSKAGRPLVFEMQVTSPATWGRFRRATSCSASPGAETWSASRGRGSTGSRTPPSSVLTRAPQTPPLRVYPRSVRENTSLLPAGKPIEQRASEKSILSRPIPTHTCSKQRVMHSCTNISQPNDQIYNHQ